MSEGKGGLIYLATPIDFAGPLERTVYSARRAIGEAGMACYNPAGAFDAPAGMTPTDQIHKVNWRALALADGMLAVLPRDVASIGVPMEIERAARQIGMPVAIVTDADESWSLAGLVGRDGWGARIFPLDRVEPRWEQAVQWLALRIDDAARELDRRARALPFTVGEGGRLPTKAYPDDAGFDLYCSETTMVEAGSWSNVPTNVRVELEGHQIGLIKSRSSTIRQTGLMVQDGVVDSGWRGELFAVAYNPTDTAVVVQRDQRIAQLLVLGNAGAGMTAAQVDRLTDHPRGRNGFGSSGA